MEVIERACQLHREGKRRTALNLVFDYLDDEILAGRFLHVDAILAGLDPTGLPLCLNLGVLSITLQAKERLPSRDGFRARVVETLAPEEQEGLIGGL